jgi:hypothetical protein
MSRLRFTKIAQPAAPGANMSELYIDQADLRLKQIDNSGVVTVLGAGFEKNILTNGGFEFCQRAAVALTNITSPSTTNRIYSADRWGFTVGNATTPQFQQVDTNAAYEAGITARYYGRYKQLTNAAKVALTQVVEGRGSAPLRGRIVRWQAKLKWSVGTNRDMRLGLIYNTTTVDAPTAAWMNAFNANGTDPTLGALLSYVTPATCEGTGATIVGNAVTCPLTNTWTRFSATFVVPTAANNVMPAIWSNNTFAANDDLLITECGLYDGPDVQDWIPIPIGNERSRCERFYAKTFALGTVPAGSVLPGAILWGVGVAGAAAGAWGSWRFPVRMVKAPAITVWNPAAANNQVRQLSATAGDCTSSSGTSITDSSCQITCTPGATAVIGSVLGANLVAEAEL